MEKEEVLDKDRYKYICIKTIGSNDYEVRHDIKTNKRILIEIPKEV